jgi:hypothetical protein
MATSDKADTTDAPVLVRLGQVNGNVTTVGFPFGPDHEDIEVIRGANHAELNDHSRAMRAWLLSLPEHHQPYWLHVHQIDHLWPSHSEHPPIWVSCPDHPDLEALLADHFGVRGHTVAAVSAEQANKFTELGVRHDNGPRLLEEVLG